MRNKSQKAYARSKQYLPGGVNSPVRSLEAVGLSPVFIKRAAGPYLIDLDNNKYTDFCLSWGAHILGHNHPAVIKAVKRALKEGMAYGTATEKETELAFLIVKAVPSVDKIRFVNSGTEAVMSALRLARAFTKRDKIIKFKGCYHGHLDYSPRTFDLPFNDSEAVEKIFQRHKNKIAAVIVEPVPANMGVILPRENFLRYLRDITRQHGALLIFDEVVTGFRVGLAGAQGYFRIDPDLTTFGKIIGGGFPVGAFGGRKEIMDLIAPLGNVYQAGTFSGNPMTMSAGIAVLDELANANFFVALNEKSARFITALRKIVERRGGRLNAFGSMFTIFFSESAVTNYAKAKQTNHYLYRKYYANLLNSGIYLSPSPLEANFICSAHNQKLLDKFLSLTEQILKVI